jgi:hypothetical protein
VLLLYACICNVKHLSRRQRGDTTSSGSPRAAAVVQCVYVCSGCVNGTLGIEVGHAVVVERFLAGSQVALGVTMRVGLVHVFCY